jgi:hypothetical protein
MIERTLQPHLLELARRYPVLTLTGPRQSGKTTLCRMAFPDKDYVSLENPAEREFATEDPVGFLDRYPDGAVFDEIQRVPQLASTSRDSSTSARTPDTTSSPDRRTWR